MANSQEIVNGCVMTYDEQGRLVARQGGLFWDMECKYNQEGKIIKYQNSLGYSIKGYFWTRLQRWNLEWSIPTRDVFQIQLQLDTERLNKKKRLTQEED